MKDEQIYTLALSRIPGLGLMGACNLVRTLGSASAVFQHRKELKELLPEVSEKLIKALDCPEAFHRAEEELKYAEKNQIQCITLNDTSENVLCLLHNGHQRTGDILLRSNERFEFRNFVRV